MKELKRALMKKHLLFMASTFALATAVIAQPTITLADMTPAFGETITVSSTDYTDPGAGGANQTWDFSDLPISQAISQTVEDPSNHAGADDFPGTTHVFVSQVSDELGYMRFADNKAEVLGLEQAGNVMVFADGRSQLEFPLTMGTEYTDTYTREFDLGGGVSNFESGTINAVVDGYGILVLVSGTYTNVLRLTMVNTGTLDVIVAGDVISTIPFEETTTGFITAGIHTSLLSFVEYTISGQLSTIATMYAGDPLSIDASESITDFNLYPSPATTYVQMDFNLEASSDITLKLMTIDGRLVDESKLGQNPAGNNQIRFDLPSLSSGLYLLQVVAEDGTYVHRLMIE